MKKAMTKALTTFMAMIMAAGVAVVMAAPTEAQADEQWYYWDIQLADPAGPSYDWGPAVYPAVSTSWEYWYEQIPDCPTTYFCVTVPDPTRTVDGEPIVLTFYFQQCQRYSVENWHQWGGLINHQTGGVIAHLYDYNGHSINMVPANNHLYLGTVDDVWYVKAC